MTTADPQELLDRLKAFRLDSEGDRPFTDRLARANGWSAAFAAAVVEEYKRFAFLAVTADHPVVPSDQIAQVWHLHLADTASYQTFSEEVLGRPLPCRPPAADADAWAREVDGYARTLVSYYQVFQALPPATIWPPVDVRFGDDLFFVRVNTRQNWVIPKEEAAAAGRLALLGVLCGLPVGLLFGWLVGAVSDPFRATGLAFLLFYLLLYGWAFAAATVLRNWLRQPADDPAARTPALNAYEVACLVGTVAVADVVLTKLVAQQLLAAYPADHRFARRAALTPPYLPVEQAVHESVDFVNGATAEQVNARANVVAGVAALAGGLREEGLFVPAAQVPKARWLPLAVVLAVTLVGLIKAGIDLNRDRSVILLGLVCVGGAFAGALVFTRPPRRSLRGDGVAKRLAQHYGSLRTLIQAQPSVLQPSDLALGVALFGTGVLTHEELADLRQCLPSPAPAGPSFLTSIRFEELWPIRLLRRPPNASPGSPSGPPPT